MKYQAVIFDLFGTLIDNFSLREHQSVLAQMASVLSAPPDDFTRLWFETSDHRPPKSSASLICNLFRNV